MVNLKKFEIKKLPKGYTLSSSEWYQDLEKTEKSQNLKNIIFFEATMVLIFLSLTILNVLNYSSEHIAIYGTALGITLITFLFSIIKKRMGCIPQILFSLLGIAGVGLLVWSMKNIQIMYCFYFLQALLLMGFIAPKKVLLVIYILESIGIYAYIQLQNIEELYINRVEIVFPIVAILAVIILIDRHERQKLLIENIIFDKITQLPKREVLLKTKIQKENLLCLIKVSNFRDLLSNFGYELAEEIFLFASKQLKIISEKNNCRAYKLLGNEYAILMPLDQDLDEKELTEKIENIIEEMEREKMKWRGAEITLLYNFGASLIQAHEDTINSGIAKADAALKEGAKECSKLVIYNEALHKYLNPIESIIKFTTLIENKEEHKFIAEFEKVTETENKSGLLNECHVKIKGRDGKEKALQEYQEISKATGLYKDITSFALEQALEFAKKNSSNIQINISAKDIVDNDIIKRTKEKNEEFKKLNLKLYIQLNENPNKDYSLSIQRFIDKAGMERDRVFQKR
jgi:GGDEF domain-containing protein